MTDRTVLVRVKANVSDFVAGMGTARAAVRGFTKDIDTTNDRVAWLSQGILGIGPALVPLGAAAIPIFTGIATQAVVASGAVATMVLAFNGVGDALKSVNDYQLEPTTANFEKMRQALDDLGPAGAEFVTFLDSLGPQLQRLQELSREGIFPGATEGLESLMEVAPRAESLVSDLASAIGDLMSQAGAGVAGEPMAEFFDFLDRNAKPILLELGETVGNFITGFADMLVAFEPLTQQFSAGLLDMSEGFADFWDQAPEDASFQAFLDYIETSIPKALDFLASLAEAMTAIVVAAAPVGDVMLPVLGTFLDVVSTIAETPLGPIFLAAAAAVSIYGRAVALASVTTGGLLGSMKGMAYANLGINTAMKASVPSMQQWGRWAEFMGQSTENASKKTLAARSAVHSYTRSLVPAGAAVGAFALIASGAADNMGIQQTATLGLMGAMIGGAPGAVAGGLVGAVLDFKSANDKAGESARKLASDMRAAGMDMQKVEDAVMSGQTRLQDHIADITADNPIEAIGNTFDPDYWLEGIGAAMQNARIDVETTSEKMAAAWNAAQIKADDLKLAASLLAEEFGLLGDDGTASLDEMTAGLEQAQPAMDALGITVDDLIAAVRDGSILELVDDLAAWQTQSDSTEGAIEGVVRATESLDNAIISTEQSASALANALDALFSPKLNLSEALDAWSMGLKTLNNDLSKNSRTLVGNSMAALQNRGVIRDRVNSMIDVLKAEAEAGAGAGKLTRTLREQRQALMDAGEAAGMSKNQMRDYLRQLGLTPKLVETLVRAKTDGAAAALDSLKFKLDGIRSKTIVVGVVKRWNAALDEPLAMGGIHPGDVPNNHQPQIASAGTNRIWAEPETGGEAYIPLANDGRRPRAKSILELTAEMMGGRVAWYAAGGLTVDDIYARSQGASWAGSVGDEAHHAANGLKALRHELTLAEKAYEKERTQRDAIREKMTQLGSGVAGGLRDDIFASPTGSIWGQQGSAAGGANSALDADSAEAAEWIKLVRTLKNKGLRDEPLGELLSKNSIELLREYAAMSEGELSAYAKKYEKREQLLAQAGVVSGQAAYGAQEAASVAELRDLRKDVKAVEQAIKNADKGNRDGHKGSGERTSKALDKATGRGRTRA